jgi:cytosine/adenosine deaminase-related metal-dependent hydrolase
LRARIFGLEGKLGRIEPGYIADLVLVAGDLVQNLDLLGQKSNIKAVFKGGKKIDLSIPLPENWSIPGWRTGQFSSENLTYALANS